ncbi:hypothetical protein RRG50_04590 [Mycoplasmopsis felis]|nr:hypothetical protein [Mycoplasmopsis felis]WQQ11189.1 hypothetical protein RRG45_01630 [Mycoplasmopsis felis]
MKLMLYNTSGKNTVYKNIGYFDNSGSYFKLSVFFILMTVFLSKQVFF